MKVHRESTRLAAIAAAALLVIGSVTSARSRADEAADRLWQRFFDAPAPAEAARVALDLAAANVDFESTLGRLRRGREYSADVPTGRLSLSRRNRDGTEHPYLLFVPDSYDPARRYPARVYLNGGVARPLRRHGGWWRDPERLLRDDTISIFPAAWKDSPWWQQGQIENLAGMLDEVKRRYNVDENRVHAIGVSDGASGLYYHASLAPTPWAGFVPLIGHPAVIMNPRTGSDGALHLPNLANKPFYIVNVDDDRLYPVASMRSWITRFRTAGVNVTFREIDGTGHNTRWWPDEAAAIDRFIAGTPREPLPDRLTWETDRVDRFQRVDWLIVSELTDDRGPGRSGRVELEQDRNTVRMTADGVRQVHLLLSPDRFDFTRPVRIVANGLVALDRVLAPSVQTLLEWAARDNDRTQLFGAEIAVDVPTEAP